MKSKFVPFMSVAILATLCANVFAVDTTIDKRNQTDADGNKYFVVICARPVSISPPSPGHAFVTWGVEDSKRRMSIAKSFGFYPANGTGAFGAVPGSLQNEAMKPSSTFFTDRLIVRVNKSAYLNSQAACTRWATAKYSLYSSNCINFAMDVGQQIGLTVPAKGGSQTPSSYVQKLIRSN